MNELVVSATDDGLRIAILENKRLVELHHEETSNYYSVGDIFLGRVRKIVPGLNAAFVDIGHQKDAFLHYLDLGKQVRSLQKYVKLVHSNPKAVRNLGNFKPFPDIDKHGKMGQVLKSNQKILVQVAKEAISTKGPRLTCEISIAGQYLILMPFANDVSISRKISKMSEKKRLRKLVESMKPKDFGVIVRTAAADHDADELKKDIDHLVEKWEKMAKAIHQAKAPKKVLQEQGRTTSILRDMLSKGFDAITTDDRNTYDEINDYLTRRMPGKIKSLKHYTGKTKLFQHMRLERQIKASFGKTVTMANGAYLVIEHTEALHVVDVNSGSKYLHGDTLEENALKTNMEAASEIARQLRLRDMGGIVVVDFIDLKKQENKKTLNEHFKQIMKKDRAKNTVLPMSKFGLVQITRQRVRPEVEVVTTEVCPSCKGTGKIDSSILLTDDINKDVDFLMRQNKEKSLTLKVNPYVAAYLSAGFPNQKMKWFWKYNLRPVHVLQDESLGFTEVVYLNRKGEEIKLEA